MFNSLKYAKQLEEVGVSREQAEVQIQIMTEIIETNLATKQDIADLRQIDIADVRRDIRELDGKFIQLEQRLTIKLGAITSIAIGVAVTLLKLIE